MEGGFDPDCRRCMPWDEIHTPENQERIGYMKELIRLRQTEEACRSPHFHFQNRYPGSRCVDYIKIGQEGHRLEVVLNCSGEAADVQEGGEILFARNYEGGVLGKNGTLIRRLP